MPFEGALIFIVLVVTMHLFMIITSYYISLFSFESIYLYVIRHFF
jgi:hypothetical protein